MVDNEDEMMIFLPWKKFVFPDPFAPTAKMNN